MIDERSPGYLRCACDYVHLNPRRAGLIGGGAQLESYVWSSYGAYLQPRLRPSWLRVDRLLGEDGLGKDTAASRRELARRIEAAALEAEEHRSLRRGWRFGGENFVDWLTDKLTPEGRRQTTRRRDERELDEVVAERLLHDCLQAVGWRTAELQAAPKGDPVKVEIARQVRERTPMTRAWITERLHMGSAGYLSQLLQA